MNSSALEISRAFIDSHATTTLVNDIPKFDAQPRNFASWREKVESARPAFEEELFVKLVKQKLGVEATLFISGLGSRVDTVDGLMFELAQEYDEYSKPLFAHANLMRLQQGNKSLTTHHAELYQILRGMRETKDTKSQLVIAGYINSLTDERLRLKLLRRVSDYADKSSLEDLINIVNKESRCLSLSKPLLSPIAVNSASASQEGVCAASAQGGARAGYGYRRYDSNGGKKSAPSREEGKPWCTIHEAITHNTADCRMKTNTFCRFCRSNLHPQTMEEHIANCTGGRCHECKRRGHVARYCRDNAAGEQSGDRRESRQDSSSTDSSKVRHVRSGKPMQSRSHSNPNKRVAVASADSESGSESTEPAESETQTDTENQVTEGTSTST
jgi:hypothetical protein